MLNEEQIKESIAALTAAQIRTPNLPMPTALQEANDLLTYCKKPHIASRLIEVGQQSDFALELDLRIKVARQAQSEWVYVRDQTKPTELIDLEKRAAGLRSALIAAGRYNLKSGESANTIAQIRGGDSIADLIQDLHDLSTLIENHVEDFSQDRSFDAPLKIEEARSLAEELSSGVSTERVDPEPTKTREMRDRAFTYLDDFVTDLRNAGRYTFRLEPSTAKRFVSRYRRRTRGKSRSGAPLEDSDEATLDVVEEEVLGEPISIIAA